MDALIASNVIPWKGDWKGVFGYSNGVGLGDLFFHVTEIYSKPTQWDYIQCCNMWLGHRDGISCERVNDNVGNEIELGMMIPTIKSWILQVS
jgi:hypothetical protein